LNRVISEKEGNDSSRDRVSVTRIQLELSLYLDLFIPANIAITGSDACSQTHTHPTKTRMPITFSLTPIFALRLY